MQLPNVPVRWDGFIPHLYEELALGSSPSQTLAPYKKYEAKLRELFAQDPNNPVLATPNLNLVPLFAGHEDLLKTHARHLDTESPQEKDSYILPLDNEWRKPHGSPAVVQSMQQFRKNFTLFSESSLVDLDWSNVVAAGSSVITPLLPVPEKHNVTKKDLRGYYHDKLAPASDVDLFLYGLDEEQAIEKIKQIEACIKNSILEEVTSVRTKNTITIVSKYPIRHVQIVLRLYKNISEILTGFDVDCACVAYDGSQVWTTPRAVTALITQVNTIDLTRRSPSYENRLAKYRHRGFEVYWPDIDRSKVDPTIFERAFSHVLGLARLLVMEKLPTQISRDAYLDQRKIERGGTPSWASRFDRQNVGIKGRDPEDIAEWVEAEDVSNYHSLTIPYGPTYHAKKIEKILYKKDMLLNAEWNKSKKRDVNLHRHPAFFGAVEYIIKDCCPSCPVPLAQEDIEIAEEESKWFISGDIKFIKDNPGRQAIGSFNPITETDWTEMAYLSDTARLSQAIVDGDIGYVKSWCNQADIKQKIDTRNHTGRTPLHLAATCGNVEISRCLIDHGARIVARIGGGFTALHIAAYRGHVGIVKALLEKSEANKSVLESEQPVRNSQHSPSSSDEESPEDHDSFSEDNDGDTFVVSEGETNIQYATTEASFVKIQTVGQPKEKKDEDEVNEAAETNNPDIYDINVLAWDVPVSPLHLAIIHGHVDVIDTLVSSFGADVLLPAWVPDFSGEAQHASLPLALPLSLPTWQSLAVCKSLLELGVSSAQAGVNHMTSLYAIAAAGTPEHLDLLFDLDHAAAKCAINHPAVVVNSYSCKCDTPMANAVQRCDVEMVLQLLKYGNDFEVPRRMMARICAVIVTTGPYNTVHSKLEYAHPAIAALTSSPEIAELLIGRADPNTLDYEAHYAVVSQDKGFAWQEKRSLLDHVDRVIGSLKPEFETLQKDDVYLGGLREGSYKQWQGYRDLEIAKMAIKNVEKRYKGDFEDRIEGGMTSDEVKTLKTDFTETLERARRLLISKGADHFHQLHPNLVHKDSSESPTTPFTIDHKFFTTQGEQELEQKAYLNLFEAVWEGDVDTVKEMTLAPWGENHENPLLVSVRDHCKFSSLDIALGRGDVPMIKLILEIASIQYAPPTEQSPNNMLTDGTDGTDDTDSDGSSMSGVEYDNKTIAKNAQDTLDVREAAEIIPSQVHPGALFQPSSHLWRFLDNWKSYAEDIFQSREGIVYSSDDLKNALSGELDCLGYSYLYAAGVNDWSPLQFAIEKGDTELASLILELGDKCSATEPNADSGDKFTVKYEEFDLAMRRGRIDILTAIISKTGYGLPLQKLGKQVGARVEVKSEYYTGLLVNGKLKQGWASGGDSGVGAGSGITENPFLWAIYKGNIETVKWFLSGEPLTKYKEYVRMHKYDDAFENVDGGYEKVLSSWWNSMRHCALFNAVIAEPSPDIGVERLRITLDAVPEALDYRVFDGLTPLHIAFSLHRISAARYLIQRGADQEARDNKGCNILHHMMTGPATQTERPRSFKVFQTLWDLVDPTVVKNLATQKTKSDTSGDLDFSTPLILLTQDFFIPEIPQYVLQKTNGAGLRVMNGQGDYPLHMAIQNHNYKVARVLMEHDPEILHWENATGLTAVDLLDLAYQREAASIGKTLTERIQNDSTEFIGKPPSRRSSLAEFWAEIQEYCAAHPMKRKLASVMDANALVRRLDARAERAAKEKEEEGEKGEELGFLEDQFRYLAKIYSYEVDGIVEEEKRENEGKGRRKREREE